MNLGGHERTASQRDKGRLLEALLPRELEALRAAAEGLTMDEDGAARGYSAAWVREHRNAARRKLGARNTAHAVAIALRLGLL